MGIRGDWLQRWRDLRTDRQILMALYLMYRADYPTKGDPWLPIDIPAVAERLRCEPRLLFGRLHYDMGTRYKHRSPNDANLILASVFEMAAGDKRHVINFPYVVALLAGMQSENRRNWAAVALSIFAVVVSVAGVWVQFATAK
jgi:hypothetical protein